jgi:hypothetical protein
MVLLLLGVVLSVLSMGGHSRPAAPAAWRGRNGSYRPSGQLSHVLHFAYGRMLQTNQAMREAPALAICCCCCCCSSCCSSFASTA